MKKCKVLFSILFLSICIVFTFFIGFAAADEEPCIECSVVSSSHNWDENDNSTWVSGKYSLTIHCEDPCNGNAPAVGYIAQFSASIWHGYATDIPSYERLTDLDLWSFSTDANGDALLNTILMHENFGNDYVNHICPFVDVNYSCSGGSSPVLKSGPKADNLKFRNAVFCPYIAPKGCCEITITNKCTPSTSFTFCTNSSELLCGLRDILPGVNPYIEITSAWHADSKCNYCEFSCEGEDLITLSSFDAQPGKGVVTLSWTTESEINNAGFNVYRADAKDGPYAKINDELIPAEGSPTSGASYTYEDAGVKNRKMYFYKLEDIDVNGTKTMHGPAGAKPRMIFGLFGK